MSTLPDLPRVIPSVDSILRGCAANHVALYGRSLVLDVVRHLLAEARAGAFPQLVSATQFDEQAFSALLLDRLLELTRPSQRRVFNFTGTVLHTNLGRAVLPREAAEAVAIALMEPTNLEYDLKRGERGERDTHIESWLTRLTGAEAGTVVNNNAAAVLIALNTLAARREVIVSRGELIEIGGAFRMPDIMARAGCRLVEVGTTNRTHLRDFADAIGPRTAALMKVHTSNYMVQGFTAVVGEQQLAALAHERGLPFIIDLGSGMLVDLDHYGLPHEPTAREALALGADLVTFSGDKLLGGPQAGLIVGRRDLIARVNRNPLKRALRMDKLRLAALEAVLRLYADPDRLRERLPTLRWLTRAKSDIEGTARTIQPLLQQRLGERFEVTVADCRSQIGSGSLPVDLLPSAALAIRPAGAPRRGGRLITELAAAFRRLPIPLIGRIQDGALLFDLRTLEDPQPVLEQLSRLQLPEPATSNRPPRRSAGAVESAPQSSGLAP